MSYTHQKVMWSSCEANSYDEAITQSRNGTRIVNQYGDIVRKQAVTIIARKQPHEEVTTIDVGKEVLTKNIYYVDPKIEPNACRWSKGRTVRSSNGPLVSSVFCFAEVFPPLWSMNSTVVMEED